ncbi:MAG TPA: hypothetical protein DCX07_01680 [Phycisphaerales bacterium]|nr:hypothetical protein [Phycisphaerales bacterium]
MANARLRATVVFVALALLFPGLATAAPEVVYDNMTTFTSGTYAPNGFWPFSQFAPNEPQGDHIDLTGTCRVATEFDLLLSSTQAVTLSTVTLSFHPFDADLMEVGAAFWTTTLTDVHVDGPTAVIFTVPNVTVPDSLIWIVSADSHVAGLATCNPPTVGSSGDYFWDRDTYDGQWYPLWFENNPVANFGARVLAVPEPATTAALLAAAGLLAGRRRRR